MSESSLVSVFLGNMIEEPSELLFLNKLKSDLTARGICAWIYANFHTLGRVQRQIDFLVRTEEHLMLIELKTWKIRIPLSGGPNGKWIRHTEVGDEEIDNPIEQVSKAAYALTDNVEELINSGTVKDVGRFYRNLDAVVCFNPKVPDDSKITNGTYQEVVDYDDLLSQLSSTGPSPNWSDQDWSGFVMYLQLFSEDADDQRALSMRARTNRIASFCERARKWYEIGLEPAALVGGMPAKEEVAQLLIDGRSVVLKAPSGQGKSLLASHIARDLSDAGTVALWLRAGEYRASEIKTLVLRALAIHGETGLVEFLDLSRDAGIRVVFIVDGINECPSTMRRELLEQIGVLVSRFNASALLTTSTDVDLPAVVDLTMFEGRQLSTDEKLDVLAAHGIRDPLSAGEYLETPYELALAARCMLDLSQSATTADVLDAYVRIQVRSERQRQALREIAVLMESEFRTWLPYRAAVSCLANSGLSPDDIDDVLSTPLLTVSQGGLAFKHEMLGRFLLSESLNRKAANGLDLGRTLLEPQHRDLRFLTLALETDRVRRTDALIELASSSLYEAALSGSLGEDARLDVEAMAQGVLDKASRATRTATLLDLSDGVGARWELGTELSKNDASLISACGQRLKDDQLTNEVTKVLKATDELLHRVMADVRREGHPAPISTVLQAALFWGHDLPVALLYERVRLTFRHGPAHGIAARLLDGADIHSWCRLIIACHLVNAENNDDRAVLCNVASLAWKAGGYHLQLECLEAVSRNAFALEDEQRHQLSEIVGEFETGDNIFLSSTWVEALAALGEIEAIRSLEQIIEQIYEVVATPRDAEAIMWASSIFSNQFEREDVVGPYSEAIRSVDRGTRFTLIAMASLVPDRMSRQWALESLMKEAFDLPDGTHELINRAFYAAAGDVALEGVMPQDDISAHVLGCRGYARMNQQLRVFDPTDDQWCQAWRLVDQLIAAEEGVDADTSAAWQYLVQDLAASAIDVLFVWRRASYFEANRAFYIAVIARHPAEYAELLNWSLAHLDQLSSGNRFIDSDGRMRFIIEELGRVGEESSVQTLEAFRSDPLFADCVLDAIRSIRSART